MEKSVTRRYELPYRQEWWGEVREDLLAIRERKLTGKQLKKKLQEFCLTSAFYQTPPDLECLFAVEEVRLTELFARIAEQVLRFEQHPPEIPFLRQKDNLCHSFPKEHVVLLMCLMAILLTPSQELERYDSKKNFPREFNFAWIFSFDAQKLQPILNYLERVLIRSKEELQQGRLEIIRAYQPLLTLQQVLESAVTLTQMRFYMDKTSIQEFPQSVKIDFANKYIGGGSLDYGNVQEEIMFLCHPELFVSMLLCQRMLDNETLAFRGFRKYYAIKGYGEKLAYDSEETTIKYDYDKEGTCLDYIVAIDALKKPDPQFSDKIMMRQLNKAHIGFKQFPEVPTVATGNWGCGVFGGDVQLKFVLQWMAASLAGKRLHYCTFEARGMEEVQLVVDRLRGLKVGELMKLLLPFESQMKEGRRSVFGFLLKKTDPEQ